MRVASDVSLFHPVVSPSPLCTCRLGCVFVFWVFVGFRGGLCFVWFCCFLVLQVHSGF